MLANESDNEQVLTWAVRLFHVCFSLNMLGNPCSTGRPSPTGILHLLVGPSALAVLFLPVGTITLTKLLVQSCTWLSFKLQFSSALFAGYASMSLSRGVPLRRCRQYVPCTHTHCCIVSLGRDLANGDVLVALMVPGFDDPEFRTYHCRLSIAVRRLLWEALCLGFQSVSKRCMSWYEIATSAWDSKAYQSVACLDMKSQLLHFLHFLSIHLIPETAWGKSLYNSWIPVNENQGRYVTPASRSHIFSNHQ